MDVLLAQKQLTKEGSMTGLRGTTQPGASAGLHTTEHAAAPDTLKDDVYPGR